MLNNLIIAGRAEPSFVVSQRLPLDDAPEAYERFDRREEGYSKVVLTPSATVPLTGTTGGTDRYEVNAMADAEPQEEFSALQKYAAEAIGIFFLVFVGAGAAAMTLIISAGAPSHTESNTGIGALGGAGDWLTIALAFGLIIMAMIYIFGHVSGAHINPAVTLAFLIRKQITLTDAVGYWVAQLVGAILGAFAIALVYGTQAWEVGGLGAVAPFPGIPLWQAATAEAIGTFGLVIGVLAMTLNRPAPAGWAGLVIGLNIAALIILLGRPLIRSPASDRSAGRPP